METEETIFRRFQRAVRKYPRNVALGYKIDGNYKTITYEKLLDEVNRCVTGLKKLGVEKGDKVAIFSNNRPAWVKLDLALNKMGAISVPIHTTLSPKLIKYILNDSEARYLVIGDLFSKYQEIKNEVNLKQVITFKNIEWHEGLVNFEDVLKNEIDKEEPEIFDVSTIIYTSGTTGDPKGVMLTNKNFISNIDSAIKYVPYTSKDKLLSFLPLSHVLERTAGYYVVLFNGGSIYYATNIKTISGDLKEVKPTIIVCVPRIFEKVYDKIMDKIRLESKFKQKLFFNSLKVSRKYHQCKRDNHRCRFTLYIKFKVLNIFILDKVRKSFGGHLKFSISGGASLNPSIAKFFEAVGIKILEGYGLTETSPIISVNPIDNYKFGTVGKIISLVKVKIDEDKEILVKGLNVMKGYYNDNRIENEWFRTGDLGYLDEDNYLTIVGRKKEMIITSTGKNINPEKIENILQESKYIYQSMVIGEKQKYLSAFIVPDFKEIMIYAKEKNIEKELIDLLKTNEIIELIRSEIKKQLSGFSDNEQIIDFKILEREFSQENDELTPTMKLRRNKILENNKINL